MLAVALFLHILLSNWQKNRLGRKRTCAGGEGKSGLFRLKTKSLQRCFSSCWLWKGEQRKGERTKREIFVLHKCIPPYMILPSVLFVLLAYVFLSANRLTRVSVSFSHPFYFLISFFNTTIIVLLTSPHSSSEKCPARPTWQRSWELHFERGGLFETLLWTLRMYLYYKLSDNLLYLPSSGKTSDRETSWTKKGSFSIDVPLFFYRRSQRQYQ